MKKLLLILMVAAMALAIGCTQIAVPQEQQEQSFVPSVGAIESESSHLTPQESQHVIIEHSSFLPADVEVRVGDTVEWVNTDDEIYTFDLEGITGARLPIGGRMEYQFSKAGVYSYTARPIETRTNDDTQDRILHGVVLVE